MSEFKLPIFEDTSYKGQKGKVLIVGGSKRYHGAPIFSLLAAENSGADLITAFIPSFLIPTVHVYSLNVFVRDFVHDTMGLKDIAMILNTANKYDAMLMGIGLDQDDDTKKAMCMIIQDCDIPMILDADALTPQILEFIKGKTCVLTPHAGEYQRLFGAAPTLDNVKENALKYGVTIVVKGPTDYIASPNEFYANPTGCPQMRVGGTGDALAGIITAFISMGLSPFDASRSACHYYGLLGMELAKSQFCLKTLDLINAWPEFLHSKMGAL